MYIQYFIVCREVSHKLHMENLDVNITRFSVTGPWVTLWRKRSSAAWPLILTMATTCTSLNGVLPVLGVARDPIARTETELRRQRQGLGRSGGEGGGANIKMEDSQSRSQNLKGSGGQQTSRREWSQTQVKQSWISAAKRTRKNLVWLLSPAPCEGVSLTPTAVTSQSVNPTPLLL